MGDVHTEHCCTKHGCKYGSKDCTVYHGDKKQAYPCEICLWEEKEFLQAAEDRALIALVYTENHPDRETTFLGIFSSEEKAQKARDNHDAMRKATLPQLGNRIHGFYFFHESELDSEDPFC